MGLGRLSQVSPWNAARVMRLSRWLILSFLLLLVALPQAHAQGSALPYTVVVPVKDTSEAERNQAFATGLGQVLVRVAGGQDLRGKSGYDEALKGASGIVQQYQYQRGGGSAPSISLQVSFDQGAVDRTIATLGVPSAGMKPPVLAIVRRDGGDPLGKAALGALLQSATARGYNVITADESNPPDVEALQKADPAALTDVTRDYKTGLVLIGNLNGNNADWTLVSGGRAQQWKDQAASADALLGNAGNTLGDRLGKQLNVIGASAVDGKLWVSGIASATDYANLLAVLRADPAVHQVNTLQAQGDGMLFQLKADLPLDTLAANLAAGGRLLQAAQHSGADASLRWLH